MRHDFVLGLVFSGVAGLVSNLNYKKLCRYCSIHRHRRRKAYCDENSHLLVDPVVRKPVVLLQHGWQRHSLLCSADNIPVCLLPAVLLQAVRLKNSSPTSRDIDNNVEKTNVAVFGAGSLGLSVKQMIETTPGSGLRIIALIEDDPSKIGKKIQGYKIIRPEGLSSLVKDRGYRS